MIWPPGKRMPLPPIPFLFAFGLIAGACETEQAARRAGAVRVAVSPDDSIQRGLAKGEAPENARDYAVSYTKFIVSIGNVRLGHSTFESDFSSGRTTLIDFVRLGEPSAEIARFDDVPSGEWSEFSFDTPRPKEGVHLVEVTAADAVVMIENGWTHWIEGTVGRPVAEGGALEFIVQTAVPTSFSRCERDGEPGVNVVQDQTTTALITMHGDHLWFTSFATGIEGQIERRTAWILQADQNRDGAVTTEELASLDATEVFTTELGYSLDGPPAGVTIETALDFVRAQLVTQGHFKGEGECIWQLEDASRSGSE
jgi:hypothetical protein